ncbi:MAG: hypothetical protein KBA07_11075 [Petrotogaceae bacterium]|nr:hypothetical protein [Petrotogaceae bacterium]
MKYIMQLVIFFLMGGFTGMAEGTAFRFAAELIVFLIFLILYIRTKKSKDILEYLSPDSFFKTIKKPVYAVFFSIAAVCAVLLVVINPEKPVLNDILTVVLKIVSFNLTFRLLIGHYLQEIFKKDFFSLLITSLLGVSTPSAYFNSSMSFFFIITVVLTFVIAVISYKIMKSSKSVYISIIFDALCLFILDHILSMATNIN